MKLPVPLLRIFFTSGLCCNKCDIDDDGESMRETFSQGEGRRRLRAVSKRTCRSSLLSFWTEIVVGRTCFPALEDLKQKKLGGTAEE